jgi:hypothetical protein
MVCNRVCRLDPGCLTRDSVGLGLGGAYMEGVDRAVCSFSVMDAPHVASYFMAFVSTDGTGRMMACLLRGGPGAMTRSGQQQPFINVHFKLAH